MKRILSTLRGWWDSPLMTFGIAVAAAAEAAIVYALLWGQALR